jgi:hypothetical protein
MYEWHVHVQKFLESPGNLQIQLLFLDPTVQPNVTNLGFD